MQTSNTVQQFIIEHFHDNQWEQVAIHPDRSSAESALARWVEHNTQASEARILHRVIKTATDTWIIKQLELNK